MGRRKQEPASVHRQRIATATQTLFMEQGIETVTMDDIAKAAGYSKATLYVYFKNKEEIIGLLVLESMQKLHETITTALNTRSDTKERYDAICHGLLAYQKAFPFYFQLALEQINIDFTASDCLPEEKETYRVGEKINQALLRFLQEGIACGTLRGDLAPLPTIFSFWGMLSGLIRLSANKEAYIAQEMALTQDEFLTQSFDLLYRSISVF